MLREPIPVVLGPVRKTRCFAYAIVVDPIVGDVGLIGERGPCAEDERVLADGFHRFCEVDGHEPLGHLCVRLCFGIVLFPAKVAEILGEQFATSHSATVIVQVIMDYVGVVDIHAGVFVGLILGAITLVILIENVMVVDEGVGSVGKKF